MALKAYVDAAVAGNLLRSPVSLSNFFRPDTFFNALRQKTAQATGVAMDSLVFKSAWGEAGVAGATLSVQLTGLQIQGCVFDGQRLSEADRETPTLVKVPTLSVAYVQEVVNHDNDLEVPLYAATDRSKLLARLYVPCASNANKWILAGVAMFLA